MVEQNKVRCPHCRQWLRVPLVKELAKLGAVLSEVPEAVRMELRCRKCGENSR